MLIVLRSWNRTILTESEPHHSDGAGTASFWRSRNRIILAEPEPHHSGGAGTASFWRSWNCIILAEPEPHQSGGARAVSRLGSGSSPGHNVQHKRFIKIAQNMLIEPFFIHHVGAESKVLPQNQQKKTDASLVMTITTVQQ
jgi:hypothetical protein